MNRKNTKQYQMLVRVADFGTRNASLFPKTTAASEIVAALSAAVQELSDQASTRVSVEAAIRTARSVRHLAREGLTELLQKSEQTGRALNSDKFRMPAKGRLENILST